MYLLIRARLFRVWHRCVGVVSLAIDFILHASIGNGAFPLQLSCYALQCVCVYSTLQVEFKAGIAKHTI